MNTTGRRRTPARFIASCASPRADAPSPNQPRATRFSSRIRNASAQPTATGSIAGRWLTIASIPRARVGHVHVAVAALRRPVRAAHVLREDLPGLDTAGHVHAHVAEAAACPIVVWPHRRGDADGRRHRCRGRCRTSPRGESCPACRGCCRAPRFPRVNQHVRYFAEQVFAVEARFSDLRAGSSDGLGLRGRIAT
jgi:hypothetical protein